MKNEIFFLKKCIHLAHKMVVIFDIFSTYQITVPQTVLHNIHRGFTDSVFQSLKTHFLRVFNGDELLLEEE